MIARSEGSHHQGGEYAGGGPTPLRPNDRSLIEFRRFTTLSIIFMFLQISKAANYGKSPRSAAKVAPRGKNRCDPLRFGRVQVTLQEMG